jgi:hypothetical protein
MRTLPRLWLAFLSTSLLALAHAATPQPPAAQAVIDALTRANAAVVGVQVRAPRAPARPRRWGASAAARAW